MLRVTAITTSKSWLTFIIKTYNTLMTTLELVSYLLRTDIVTCRSANAAKNAICDNKISNTINYNSRSNYYMHSTSIKLVEDRPTKIQTDQQTDRPTDRPTDIATYRAAIASKNNTTSLKTYLFEILEKWGQTDWPTNRQTGPTYQSSSSELKTY